MDYTLGSAEDSPCGNKLGSLIDLQSEASVTVLHVPEENKLSDSISLSLEDNPSHLLIVLEEGAQADVSVLIESQQCSMEILLEPSAKLTLLCLQKADVPEINITQRSRVGEGAHIYWQNVTLGGESVVHDLLSEVVGLSSRSDIDWVFYGKNREKQKLSARNVFLGKNGGGEITLRGVAEDTSHVVCDGMIDIGSGGTGTDTFLTEEVLMLDTTAKVDAIPGLNIKTNDVKASHSASVSCVTPAELFYFASRGISEEEARRMYVRGFLGDLTKRIANDAVRESVLAAIESKYLS